MTDLDDALAGTSPELVTSISTATPRKCRHPRNGIIGRVVTPEHILRDHDCFVMDCPGHREAPVLPWCAACGRYIDPVVSRRSRNNRSRGNAAELDVARGVGGRKVGPLGLTVRIEGRPPTPNSRRHWRVTALDNETWKGTARAAAMSALPQGWRPLTRASMDVLFIVGTRAHRDLDNLIASTKPLTDGLVAAGVIADDSLDVLTSVRFGCEYRKGENATIYTITEADDVG